MTLTVSLLPLLLLTQADPLGPGTHERTLEIGGQKRQYIVHVPKNHDASKPAPLVLAYHGAGMGHKLMMGYSNLNKKAEAVGFIVVYPNGSGTFPTWNAGGWATLISKEKTDDVAFTRALLDELDKGLKIDRKRTYACGLSNGAMMCYRLAAELPGRIVAIAPVAGTMTIPTYEPKQAVPVLHIHGTLDTLVPYHRRGAKGKEMPFVRMRSVDESVQVCVKAYGCKDEPEVVRLKKKEGDPTEVVRTTYQGKNGSEVVLYTIEKGGHTWPGAPFRLPLVGHTSTVISANEVMWEFFEKHARKE